VRSSSTQTSSAPLPFLLFYYVPRKPSRDGNPLAPPCALLIHVIVFGLPDPV
jgi:hypothetical protein